MIKFVAAAVWIAAVTLGTVYYAFTAASTRVVEEQEPGFFGGLDYIKTDMISVPLLDSEKVYGYFLARLVYTVYPEKLKTLTVPADALLMDQVYSYLYANPEIDFANKDGLDLDALRTGIRDSINARVGDTLVHEILIEQIDFLSKTDIRDNTIRRRAAAVEAVNRFEAAASPPAAEEDAGH